VPEHDGSKDSLDFEKIALVGMAYFALMQIKRLYFAAFRTVCTKRIWNIEFRVEEVQ
jgi:hypothetical protein